MLTLFSLRRLLFQLSEDSVEEAAGYLKTLTQIIKQNLLLFIAFSLCLSQQGKKLTGIFFGPFCLNKNILSDLLSIFRSDSQIGLIGMVGYDTVSPDGIMWHAKKSGALYEAAGYPCGRAKTTACNGHNW